MGIGKRRTILWLYLLLIEFLLYSLPGIIVSSEQKVPYISLESIDLSICTILNEFKLENIPIPSNSAIHTEFHKNSNRIVYATKDKCFIIKIWQKNYFHMKQFLQAYNSNFYDQIAIISAIIFDKDGECRGYVTPAMIDRTFNREKWNSYGLVLEKNKIGVNVFAQYDKQPNVYKILFDRLLQKARTIGLAMMDFCPDNCAIDLVSGNLYLIDLEDVDSISKLQELINEIYVYNPKDYIIKLFS